MTERRTVNLVNGRSISAVEVAPGEFIADPPAGSELPIYGFIKMVSTGDGRFTPRLETWKEKVRIGSDTCEEFGLGGVDQRMIRRLAFGGFLTVHQLTPRYVLLDLDSLIKHVEATKDPEFWNEDRRARYTQACAAIP